MNTVVTRASSVSQGLLDALERHGYDFFTGVPCSYFEGVYRILDHEPRYGYISAVREDSALGIAAGAYLAGRQPVVLMQNSGFAASINALASLNLIYEIPGLLMISWRGQDGHDAPEHLIVGACLEELLGLLRIDHAVLDVARLDEQLASLTARLRETRKPVALVVPRGRLQ